MNTFRFDNPLIAPRARRFRAGLRGPLALLSVCVVFAASFALGNASNTGSGTRSVLGLSSPVGAPSASVPLQLSATPPIGIPAPAPLPVPRHASTPLFARSVPAQQSPVPAARTAPSQTVATPQPAPTHEVVTPAPTPAPAPAPAPRSSSGGSGSGTFESSG
jgi:hypothetical protein